MRGFVAALTLLGCGSSAPEVCPGEIAAEAGSAVYDDPSTFVPLADGDIVYLVFGPQGGTHVWQSLRASGIQPACRVVRHVERVADGMVLFDNGQGDRFDLVPDDAGCALEYAQPSFVCIDDARDQDVFLEVRVNDGQVMVSGSVRVHVACPPPGTMDDSGNDVGAICPTATCR
jgi:hypothetical protein